MKKTPREYMIERNCLRILDEDMKAIRHANKIYAWIDELITTKGDLTC